jgi:hypothetical protein
VAGVLRTPLRSLADDLEESSRTGGVKTQDFLDGMRDGFEGLLPSERKDSPTASHLNSVLVALSSLQKHRGHATRSA